MKTLIKNYVADKMIEEAQLMDLMAEAEEDEALAELEKMMMELPKKTQPKI